MNVSFVLVNGALATLLVWGLGWTPQEWFGMMAATAWVGVGAVLHRGSIGGGEGVMLVVAASSDTLPAAGSVGLPCCCCDLPVSAPGGYLWTFLCPRCLGEASRPGCRYPHHLPLLGDAR